MGPLPAGPAAPPGVISQCHQLLGADGPPRMTWNHPSAGDTDEAAGAPAISVGRVALSAGHTVKRARLMAACKPEGGGRGGWGRGWSPALRGPLRDPARGRAGDTAAATAEAGKQGGDCEGLRGAAGKWGRPRARTGGLLKGCRDAEPREAGCCPLGTPTWLLPSPHPAACGPPGLGTL